MQRVHVSQQFQEPVEHVFAYLAEHENLGTVFGAKVKRLNDGTDGTRNGAGSAREMRVGPMPPFVETTVEVVPNELIRYRITQGGILRNHQGTVRFSTLPAGTLVDWTITFDGKLPGLGPLVKAALTRNMSRALKQLADRHEWPPVSG